MMRLGLLSPDTLFIHFPCALYQRVAVAAAWLPAEQLSGLFRRGDHDRRIARPSRCDNRGNGAARDAPRGLDDGGDAYALFAAEVHRDAFFIFCKAIAGAQMRVGKVAHVDVVAHTGAVLGVVVVAEDLH